MDSFTSYYQNECKRFSILSLVLLVLFMTMSPIVVGSEHEIAWTEDYEAAIQRAASTNSVLLLHFYGDYCPPCKLLDKKTFRDTKLVSAINNNLVPVKINADRRSDLTHKHQVTRWPTDVYLFPNGDELYRGISDQDPTVYTQKINRLLLRHRDWTVEREAIAKTTQRRQDQKLAAHTPQIQNERPVYSGSAGMPVKSQAASWSSSTTPNRPSHSTALPLDTDGGMNPNPPMLVAAAPVASQSSTSVSPVASSNKAQRVIDNPYVARQPIQVPAKPSIEIPTLQSSQSLPANQPMTNESAIATPRDDSEPSLVAVPSQRTIVAQPASVYSNQGAMPAPIYSASVMPNASVPLIEEPQVSHVLAETIGIEGFCPVALMESLAQGGSPNWVNGSPSIAVRHRGRIYHCSTELAREKLLASPDRFTPTLSCYDLVHFFKTCKLIDGKCSYGCIQPKTNRIFLFANQENLQEFERDTARYSAMMDEAIPERVAVRPEETQIR
jgi:thiol-disulfide isomerase/thioredoxin